MPAAASKPEDIGPEEERDGNTGHHGVGDRITHERQAAQNNQRAHHTRNQTDDDGGDSRSSKVGIVEQIGQKFHNLFTDPQQVGSESCREVRPSQGLGYWALGNEVFIDHDDVVEIVFNIR